MREKLCVITGSSSGIGKAVTEMLLQNGWEVWGVARRESTLVHPDYRHVQLDLANLTELERYFEGPFAAQAALASRTQVALINNAGLLEPVKPTRELPLAQVQLSFTVNTVAPIWLMGCFLRLCQAVPLRIVNISSGAARRALPGWSVYCASKAALLMAGQAFEAEMAAALSPQDAVLVSYSPGTVDTAMQAQIRGHDAKDFPPVDRFIGLHEKGELAQPDHPARDIVALLEEQGLPVYSDRERSG